MLVQISDTIDLAGIVDKPRVLYLEVKEEEEEQEDLNKVKKQELEEENSDILFQQKNQNFRYRKDFLKERICENSTEEKIN